MVKWLSSSKSPMTQTRCLVAVFFPSFSPTLMRCQCSPTGHNHLKSSTRHANICNYLTRLWINNLFFHNP